MHDASLSLSRPLHPVNAQQKETEAIKLMTVRAGLLDMSRSWEMMGKKCSLLAQSQQVSQAKQKQNDRHDVVVIPVHASPIPRHSRFVNMLIKPPSILG